MPNNPEIAIRHDNPFKDYQNKFVHTQADPLVINWKGKIGYGDIISPISYALNLAEKNSTDVILKFHWPYDSPRKYKPEDRETLRSYITIPSFNMNEFHMLPSFIDQLYPQTLGLNPS